MCSCGSKGLGPGKEPCWQTPCRQDLGPEEGLQQDLGGLAQ